MRYQIEATGTTVNGYGRCWFCSCDSVDPWIYTVSHGALYDGPDSIVVCDTDDCVTRAESNDLYATGEDDSAWL